MAKGFAEADVIIEREYSTQTVEHAFIEPEAGLAVPDANGPHHRLLRRPDPVRRPQPDRRDARTCPRTGSASSTA